MNVQVMINGFWLKGTLDSAGTRIQDVLNDGTSDFIRLTNVSVLPIGEMVPGDGTLQEAVIPKVNILLAALPTSQHEAPERRWNNYNPKSVSKAIALVGSYCIYGELPLSAKSSDSLFTFTHQLGKFFPLTNVSMTGPDRMQLSMPVVLVQKASLDCLSLGVSKPVALLRSQPSECDGAQTTSSARQASAWAETGDPLERIDALCHATAAVQDSGPPSRQDDTRL